jgi:hypothetical protein
MSMTHKRIGIALLSVVMTVFVVVKTVGWVDAGCPIGFAWRSHGSGLPGRTVIASSDHLLTHLDVHTRQTSVRIYIEGRQVDVAGDQVVIDKGRPITVPSASKLIVIAAKGDALIVYADGEKVAEVGR